MRTIKSFVLRAGRHSSRQQVGLEQWLPHYQLEVSDQPWDWATCFGTVADVVVEIGFGMGQTLLTLAQADPATHYLGVEVHRAGIGNLAMALHEHQIENVRIAPYDAQDVLRRGVPAESLAGINIFFPDPWPKARHKKRRLIQADFVLLLVSRLRPGGYLHLATDWQDYADQMLEVLSQEPDLLNLDPRGGFIPRPGSRPITKFEQRGLNLGHKVWDLQFKRKY